MIARIVARDASEVETRLRRLDEVYGLVYQLREERLADGRPSVRYRFVHTLCRDALWASLTPTRRDTLSGQVRHAVDVLRPGHRGDVSAPATHAEGAAARMRYGRPPGAGPRTGEVIIV